MTYKKLFPLPALFVSLFLSILSLPLVSQTLPVFSPKEIKEKLSDAEIAFIAVTANQIDIDYGKIAKTKSTNPDVLNFAEAMIRDHSGVIVQASALAKKLGVTPKDNSVSKKMNADAVEIRKTLRSKSGKAFDKAYIDNEVKLHKAVINSVETTLIPECSNAELKKLLQDILPVLHTHLEHAEMLQKKIE